MNILILGGAGLTGPHQARYALSRGHTVTLFNRGRTALPPDLAGVEQLHGDRATGDLRALRGRTWDVCIDNPTTLPSWARDAAQALAGRVGRYIFISTISVYADTRKPPVEGDAVQPYQGADPYAETMDTVRASGFALYGALKALSEQEVQRRFPSACAIVRPGLIVGPGDETDRFTYWPRRLAAGGEVLAPGDGSDPVQFIDARDLAAWHLRQAEAGATGFFNLTGPAQPLSLGALFATLRDTLAPQAVLVEVDEAYLLAQGVAPWSDLPVWLPRAQAALHQVSIARALAAGLTTRPLVQTVTESAAWLQQQAKLSADTLSADAAKRPAVGLSPEREAALLAQRPR